MLFPTLCPAPEKKNLGFLGRSGFGYLVLPKCSGFGYLPNYFSPIETQVTPILVALLADCPASLFFGGDLLSE